MASKSSKKLAEKLTTLGQKVLRVRASGKYQPQADDIIINWGNTKTPNWSGNILNQPEVLSTSRRKDMAMAMLQTQGVRTPEFTSDINIARTWTGGIVERHVLRGHSGDGIRITTAENLTPAPLYTKFIEKDGEYRVHIFNGECIDYIKKIDDENSLIGWRFLRGVSHIEENIEIAKSAVIALGLDFGAVDIIREDKKSYVLEVNTACGMEGEITSTAYANAIIKYGGRN